MESEEIPPQQSGIILEEQTELTLDEISRACAVQVECIIELVDEGVLTPAGRDPACWSFTGVHLHRTGIALRLQRDLGINLAGVALALQLLDEVKMLRARLSAMGVSNYFPD